MDDTSLEAFEAVKPTIHKTHRKVIEALKAGDATVSEIRARVGLEQYVNIHTRLSEMKRSGMIVPTDETRVNERGRSERVLTLGVGDIA